MPIPCTHAVIFDISLDFCARWANMVNVVQWQLSTGKCIREIMLNRCSLLYLTDQWAFHHLHNNERPNSRHNSSNSDRSQMSSWNSENGPGISTKWGIESKLPNQLNDLWYHVIFCGHDSFIAMTAKNIDNFLPNAMSLKIHRLHVFYGTPGIVYANQVRLRLVDYLKLRFYIAPAKVIRVSLIF